MLLALLQADLGCYLALLAAAVVAGDEGAARGQRGCWCSMQHAGVAHRVDSHMHHAVLHPAAAAAAAGMGKGHFAEGVGWGDAGRAAGRRQGAVVSVDR